MSKRAGLIAAIAVSALVPATPAAAAAQPTNFRVSWVVPMTFVGGGSAGYGIAGEATDAAPGIGRVTIAASMAFSRPVCGLSGCTYHSSLALDLPTPAGETVSLVAAADGSTPVDSAGTGSWSIAGGSGRFSGLTGSGSYAYTIEPAVGQPSLFGIATITLEGTLTHR
jgi:hypothetical protein